MRRRGDVDLLRATRRCRAAAPTSAICRSRRVDLQVGIIRVEVPRRRRRLRGEPGQPLRFEETRLLAEGQQGAPRRVVELDVADRQHLARRLGLQQARRLSARSRSSASTSRRCRPPRRPGAELAGTAWASPAPPADVEPRGCAQLTVPCSARPASSTLSMPTSSAFGSRARRDGRLSVVLTTRPGFSRRWVGRSCSPSRLPGLARQGGDEVVEGHELDQVIGAGLSQPLPGSLVGHRAEHAGMGVRRGSRR